MLLVYLVICIAFGISLRNIFSQVGPINPSNNRGYVQKGDTLETTLARIEWSNHHKGRVSYVARYFGWAVVLAFIASVILIGTVPDGVIFLQCVLVVWVVLMCLHSFCDFHADKFSHYAIDQNVGALRKHLGLVNRKVSLSPETNKPPPTSRCFTFRYSRRLYT